MSEFVSACVLVWWGRGGAHLCVIEREREREEGREIEGVAGGRLSTTHKRKRQGVLREQMYWGAV